MNPNSQHQRWSYWKFEVFPKTLWNVDPDSVKQVCARYAKNVAFGSVTQMRITRKGGSWVVEVRTEGAPVHDPDYVKNMHAQWEALFTHNFGPGTVVLLTTKLLAGSREDGSPADQLIFLPPLHIN